MRRPVPARRLGRAWAVAIAMTTLAGAACGDDGEVETASVAPANGAAAGDVLEVERPGQASWDSAADPGELVAMSDVVVLARPTEVDEQLIKRIQLTGNAVEEYYSREVEVLTVLGGRGVRGGDRIDVARLSFVVDVLESESGVRTRERSVGGGYPGPLTGDMFVLGLTKDFPGASPGVWGLVAGAHGMIQFSGGDEPVVASPRPGYDGQLQGLLAGRSEREVRAGFREAAN